MKRLIIVSIVILILPDLAPAMETAARGFSIGPAAGIQIGRVKSIEYASDGGENKYVTVMTWDLLPAVTIGLDFRWDSGSISNFKIKLHTAIPGLPTGTMNQHEWLDPASTQYSQWTQSSVQLRYGVLADFMYNVQIGEKKGMRHYLGFGWHLDLWAWGDQLQRASYPLTVSGADSGEYTSAYSVVPLAYTIEVEKGRLFFSLTGRIGPVLAVDYDKPSLRTRASYSAPTPGELYYYGLTLRFPWLDLGTVLGIRTDGFFTFFFEGEFAWLPESRGWQFYQNSGGLFADGWNSLAGFALTRYSLSIGLRWQTSGWELN